MYSYTNYKDGCKKLRRLLLRDKLISGLLILDALLCVAGIIAYVLFRGSGYPWWASPVSCVASVVLFVVFLLLLCRWFESDHQVQVAKGNETDFGYDD